MFFKRLVDMKKDRVKLKIIPKTNKENNSADMVVLDSLTVISSYQVV